MITKKPFTNYSLDEDKKDNGGKVFTIRLSAEEVSALSKAKGILQQEKNSTTLKQLAMYGLYVLHDRSTAYILDVLNHNIKKNRRLGIQEVDTKA